MIWPFDWLTNRWLERCAGIAALSQVREEAFQRGFKYGANKANRPRAQVQKLHAEVAALSHKLKSERMGWQGQAKQSRAQLGSIFRELRAYTGLHPTDIGFLAHLRDSRVNLDYNDIIAIEEGERGVSTIEYKALLEVFKKRELSQ